MKTAPADVLKIVGGLRAGATMCPGELARRLGESQESIRPLLIELAKSGRLAITQRGRPPANLDEMRGPYRVAPARR